MKTDTQKWVVVLYAILSVAMRSNATDLVWIGGTGNWNAAGNWSPAQIPGSADNAIITNSGIYTVTIPAGTTATVGTMTVGGASGAQTLALDRATLTVSGASVVNVHGRLDFLVSQSVLTGAGNLTINGTVNWANGTISGTGAVTIEPGGVLAIGSGGVTLGRTLNNGGTVTWSGGNMTLSSGVIVSNLASGTFDITADGRLSGSATTPIDNSGLFRQTAGTAGSTLAVPFNNNSLLQVLAATLNLNLGGTHTGTMSNALGATLNLGGGSHVLASSSLATGSGALSVSGNTTILTANGTFDAGSTLSVLGGTVTLAPTCILTGAALNISGNGVLNFNSSGTVASVNLTGGTLGGTSPVTVTGTLTLGGGTVTNARVTGNGGININGGVTLNGGKLINNETAIWSAGNFTGANGAVFSNLFGATFITTFDGNAPSGAGAPPTFVNAGTFKKTGGTAPLGTSSIDFLFINTGTVEVQTNTLRYGNNQQTAGLTLLDGGALDAQAQPIQILGGSFMGAGAVTVANTQNFINSASVSPGLPFGELDIAGNYQQTASGVLNIELGGDLPGTNFDVVTVAAGGAGGVATLAGTLNVTLTNGFSPTNGATFVFLTALSRVGAFSTFIYPSNEIGMQVSYEPTSATLKVTNLKPTAANPISAPPSVTYGGAFNFQFPASAFSDPDNDLLTYTVSGLPPGISFVGSTRTFSGAAAQAGEFPVTVTATDNGIPSLSATNTFTITVTPAPLTITPDNHSKAYGAELPTLTASYIGFVNGDTLDSLTTPPIITVAASPSSPVGGYQISASGAADSNYAISYLPGTLTVTPVVLTITANDKSMAYGAELPPLTVRYSGFVNGDSVNSLTTLPSTITTGNASSGVGVFPITPSGAVDPNYTINYVPGTLTITPSALTVVPVNASRAYGQTNPAFVANYVGFVNGETNTVLTGPLVLSTVANTNSSVGSYSITGSGLSASNYSITFSNGTLAVLPQSLTITAKDAIKTYGASEPLFTASYSGFVNGETNTVLGGTLGFSRAAGENVGTYVVTPSGFTSANYSITFANGTLTIEKAPLLITANDQSKAYGAELPPLTVRYSGFVNGDTVNSLTTLPSTTTTGNASSGVGDYPITPSGAVDPNYTVSFIPGTLRIIPSALTVVAMDASRGYGHTNPAFAAVFIGFVNGETNTALGGALVLSTIADTNSPVGGYPIEPSGLSATNYSITFSNGTLDVLPQSLTILAQDAIKTYGASDPVFAASFSGFVNGETNTALDGILALSRVSGEDAGTYAIAPSGVTSTNYAITFVNGTLTIGKAPLLITAHDQSKAYGAELPTLAVSYSGFVNGDTAQSLTTLPIVTTAASASSAVGNYQITASGAVDSNYAISYAPGTFTVNPVVLTITANNQVTTYGAELPPLTVNYSGFVNGDTVESLTPPPTTITTGSASSAVGSYPITSSGAVNANYTINYVPGALTITPSALTVVAVDASRAYGNTNPAFAAIYVGFVNGETNAVLAGPLVLSTTANTNSPVGNYPITASGLSSSNYSITFSNGTLAVLPQSLIITAQDKHKTYGVVDPVFTASYSGFVNGQTNTVLDGTIAFSRVAGENAGTYAITPSGLSATNYAISFIAGTLMIDKAPLSITADAKTKSYGQIDPDFTVTYGGFVNGETATTLGGTLALARVVGESVGTYLITPGGVTSPNYSITFNTGVLTITAASPPAILAITGTGTAGVVITWSAVNTVTYRVQYKSDLNESTWTDLDGDVTATGSVASKTDAQTASNRFYRVHLLP